MPKLKSLAELRALRENVQNALSTRLETSTTITVGMGTCGIAAGARETMQAILRELQAQDIEAHVATVGCIGMCSAEPLVDIEQAGKPRITYQNITSDKVSHLITEHLKNGGIVDEWVFARLSKDR